ncbi:MAG TPA: roadblock/LC7 domain-containing protein [Gaiellaceae bacterium]|nr:roadblock/LC7 domain-containing protein [Gaiellaceae bacterium]
MDAAQALADLTEISTQIETATLFDEDGQVLGSTLDETGGTALAAAAARLLEQAGALGGGEVAQLEASVQEGSVFVVRDGARRIAATTGPAPTVGLVFYDLKSCLRAASEDAKPKRRRAPKKAADEA